MRNKIKGLKGPIKNNPDIGQILKTFFTTYAVVLLVVFALSTAFIWNAFASARDKQNDLIHDQLKAMTTSFDADISFFQFTVSHLSQTPSITKLANLGKELTGSDRYDIYMAVQTLASLFPSINIMSEGQIKDIYIYCVGSGVFVSPTTMYGLDYFVNAQYIIGEESFLAFRDEVLASERNRFYLSINQQNKKQYFYFQRLSSWPLNMDLLAIIALQPEKSIITSEAETTNGSNYMVNMHEEFIIQNDTLPIGGLPGFTGLAGNSGQENLKIDGENCIVTWSYSPYSGWKYVNVMPLSVYNADVNFVKQVSFFYITMLCLFGIVTALVISTRRYHSLAEIITAMSGFISSPDQIEKENKGKPQLAIIKAGLDQLINLDRGLMQTNREAAARIGKYQQELQNNLQSMRHDFIYKILTGQTEYEIVSELLSMYSIDIPYPLFISMVIHIDDCQSFMAEDTPKEREIARNAVSAIVEESIAWTCYSCSIGYDSLGIMVNYDSSDSASNAVEQSLHANMDRIRDLIQAKLNICASVGIGREHKGLDGCTKSYYEAVQALGYKFYLGLGVVISYSDIQFAPKSFYYSIEEEMHIIHCLRNGDEQGCFTILTDIFNRNLSSKMMDVKTVNLLFLNMMNLVTRVMNDDKRLRFELERGEDAFQGLIQSSTMQEMKDNIYNLYASACRRVIQAGQSGKQVVIDQVVKYCNDHFTDINLSQAEVAGKFGLAPSVLSLQFKKVMELNMTEYISFLRVQKLKEIFEYDGTVLIYEAAQSAGFNSVKTMIRVFKRFEGVTPGSYRRTHDKIENRENP